MPTRTAAPSADALRIEGKAFRVRPHPAHGEAAILHRGGILRGTCEPVFDVRDHVALLRKREPEGAEAFLVAPDPSAAMHEHASGQHGVILRTINIELQLLLGSLAIHDVELGFERGRDFGGSCHTLS